MWRKHNKKKGIMNYELHFFSNTGIKGTGNEEKIMLNNLLCTICGKLIFISLEKEREKREQLVSIGLSSNRVAMYIHIFLLFFFPILLFPHILYIPLYLVFTYKYNIVTFLASGEHCKIMFLTLFLRRG